MAIRFVNSGAKASLRNKPEIKNWLQEIASEEGFKAGEITITFCSDSELLGINQEFLKHDTLTDIITFDYSEGDEISGELHISVDRVSENAASNKVSVENELLRVMAHGVLHLCGYGDKSADEKSRMRERENFYLSKI